jgi:hypothetical protein
MYTIQVALEHVVERGSRGFETQPHLLDHDLCLALTRATRRIRSQVAERQRGATVRRLEGMTTSKWALGGAEHLATATTDGVDYADGARAVAGPCAANVQVASNSCARVQAIDWGALERALDVDGYAVVPKLLTSPECRRIRAMYSQDTLFRSRVVMARHGFGLGEYKYFAYPLPSALAELRGALYQGLATVANRWNAVSRIDERFPETHTAFLRRCHAAGQTRPTPLLLRYVEGNYNCLHQDLYGEHVFPLQVAVLLSRPHVEFEGGEFVITAATHDEARADVVPLDQGDGLVFAVHHHPVATRRGFRRVVLRHGVSRVHSGLRFTVGLILHDAK